MTSPEERFILREGKRGKDKGWQIIVRQRLDPDFGFYVDWDEIGKFRTREDARDFMRARTAVEAA